MEILRFAAQSIVFLALLLAACQEKPLAARAEALAEAACSAPDLAAFQQIVERASRDPELARLDDPLVAQAEAAQDPALAAALQRLQGCRARHF